MTEPEHLPEPTPEQYAERAARADVATRRGLAGVLYLEALVVLLVPRAIAFTDAGLGATRTIVLVVLAVLFVLAGGMLRRPRGIEVGTLLQVLLILTGLLTWGMYIVGILFAAVWCAVLRLRRDVVGHIF